MNRWLFLELPILQPFICHRILDSEYLSELRREVCLWSVYAHARFPLCGIKNDIASLLEEKIELHNFSPGEIQLDDLENCSRHLLNLYTTHLNLFEMSCSIRTLTVQR